MKLLPVLLLLAALPAAASAQTTQKEKAPAAKAPALSEVKKEAREDRKIQRSTTQYMKAAN